MDTFSKSGRGVSAVFGALCLLLAPTQAGDVIGPNVIVEPGGVEVPLLVNVLGPEKEGDIDELREIIHEANFILQQANVQLSVARVNTGIMVGDGDRRISAVEGGEVLLGSLFELTGTYIPNGAADEDATDETEARRHHGLDKGVKLNIADDIWVEEPDRVYLDWGVLPVAFLERAGSPQETARNLVYGLALTLRVPGSSDPDNLMFIGGTGIVLDAGQAIVILEGLRPIGLERSATADGLAAELLWRLYYGRNRGVLFLSEGQGWIADFLGDVYFERGEEWGFGLGDVDLVYLKMRTGSLLTPIEQRYLTLKAVLYTTAFPDNAGVDLYLSPLDCDDPSDVDPFDFTSNAPFIFGFGWDFAGSINREGDGMWNLFDRALVQHTVLGVFTQLKIEIPFTDLQAAMPAALYRALADGGRARFAAAAHSFAFDGANVSTEDDITETTAVLKSVPEPRPTISPEAQATGASTGQPGFHVRGGTVELPSELTRDNAREFMHDFFSGATTLNEQGTGTFAYVNFSDSPGNTGEFDGLNGYPDEPFPGSDPAGGGDGGYAFLQAIAVREFPAGWNFLGVNTGGNVGFRLEVGGTVVGQSLRGLFPEDQDGANGFVPPDGDENGDLSHPVYAFYIEEAGPYVVFLQVFFKTGGTFVELHHTSSNGECDIAGSGAFYGIPTRATINQTLSGDAT